MSPGAYLFWGIGRNTFGAEVLKEFLNHLPLLLCQVAVDSILLLHHVDNLSHLFYWGVLIGGLPVFFAFFSCRFSLSDFCGCFLTSFFTSPHVAFPY